LNNLDPIEKLIFIYLLTNPYTDICGIYELPIKIMAVETGIERDNLEKIIIPKLEKSGKILCKDGWIAIKNFIKHQSINPKVKRGIEIGLAKAPKELRKFVKNSKPMIGYDSLSQSKSKSKPNSKSKLKNGENKVFAVKDLTNYYYQLKGETIKDKNQYNRFRKEAKEILELCNWNLEFAKSKVGKIHQWASNNNLEWVLSTVSKKWLELEAGKI